MPRAKEVTVPTKTYEATESQVLTTLSMKTIWVVTDGATTGLYREYNIAIHLKMHTLAT